MATRDIYETGFRRGRPDKLQHKPMSECDGRVTTNAIETIQRTVDSLLTNNESITVLNGELTIRTSESGRALH